MMAVCSMSVHLIWHVAGTTTLMGAAICVGTAVSAPRCAGQEKLPNRPIIENEAVDLQQLPADRRLNAKNLGINYPWVDHHNGHVEMLWMRDYRPDLVDEDLRVIHSLGVRVIRVFAPLDALMSYENQRFTMAEDRAENLNRFLQTAAKYELRVILVMADGNVNDEREDLSGKFRWELVRTSEGLESLAGAYREYVRRFNHHSNVLMWETANEPYANLTWAKVPQELAISQDQVHSYLRRVYEAIKPLTTGYVGFSDLHEEEQQKYRLFTSEDFRRRYIDDATDVYSIHVYRASPEQIPDFSALTKKPKWCSELGSYNYFDVTGEAHANQPANGELWNERKNLDAVTSIVAKLLDEDFELILPWAFTSNEGMVAHRPDGSHELKALPRWMKMQLVPPEEPAATDQSK